VRGATGTTAGATSSVRPSSTASSRTAGRSTTSAAPSSRIATSRSSSSTGRAAAEHLLGLGHRRIAILSFSPDAIAGSNLVTSRRLGAYLDALSDAGIDRTTVPIVEGGHYDRAAAARAVAPLLERPDRPTAILAMSDEFAAAAVDAAVGIGLRVPDDVSVVGFDDSPTATSTTPPLTTVHQDHAAKGAAAVRLLLERAPAGTQVTLPVHLVVRESTAPPPGHLSSPPRPVA
jgi:DNA-binding LacI/PurR family transcriptional regulator